MSFRLSAFHVLCGTASFSLSLLNVMCKISFVHSEHFWEDHFPHLLLSTCHMCLHRLLFLCHIKPVLLVFTSHAVHVICSPYLSSLIHCWLVDSCLQPASDTCIQHPLLTFSDEHLPSSPCYFSSLGGSCCKYALSYFNTVLQISAYNFRAVILLRIFKMVRQLLYCNTFLSWQSGETGEMKLRCLKLGSVNNLLSTECGISKSGA